MYTWGWVCISNVNAASLLIIYRICNFDIIFQSKTLICLCIGGRYSGLLNWNIASRTFGSFHSTKISSCGSLPGRGTTLFALSVCLYFFLNHDSIIYNPRMSLHLEQVAPFASGNAFCHSCYEVFFMNI